MLSRLGQAPDLYSRAAEAALEDAAGEAEDWAAVTWLEGFGTAVGLGPVVPTLGEIGARVFHPRPAVVSRAEAEVAAALLLAQAREITRDVRRRRSAYRPDFLGRVDRDEAEAEAGLFAEGFRQGMDVRPGSWQPLLDGVRSCSLLVPVLAFLSDADGERACFTADPAAMPKLRRRLLAELGSSFHQIQSFWRDLA